MKDFEKCTVLKVEYRNNSYFGNNSYWLNFLNCEGHFERGYTSPNAACGYTVQNYRGGDTIFLRYHYTKGGKCVIDSIKHNLPDEAEKYADSIKE